MRSKKIKSSDLSIMFRQIYFMLDAGIAINKAIEILIEQNGNKVLKSILAQVHKNIMAGQSLSKSLQEHKQIPAMAINMIKVGEYSGNMPEIMKQLAQYYGQQSKLIGKIKKAMVYPAIVFTMMVSVMFLALKYVIPSYAQMFSDAGANLPCLTKFVIAFSDFVNKYFLWLLIILVMAIAILRIFLKTERGKIFMGKMFYHSFMGKIYRPWVNFIFTYIMGMLLQSGVNIILALESVKTNICNRFLDKYFDQMLAQIKNGTSFSIALGKSKIFNLLLSSMIKIGEDTGNLAEIMLHCKDYFGDEIDDQLSSLEKLIEPALTIFIGIILAIVMIAIMEPTFMMSDIL